MFCLLSAGFKDVLKAALLLLALSSGFAYNLDTQFPILFSGSGGSYFGYTTALYHNKWGPMVLVGAPKSNTTTFKNAHETAYQPGTLFVCNITEERPCQEVLLMREGAKEKNGDGSFQYHDMKDDMWLGVSLDVGRKDIVCCGHRWRNQLYVGLHLTNGVCYVINGDLDTKSIKLLPLIDYYKQYKRNYYNKEYKYAMGQAGMSAVFSQDGSNLVLGATGISTWKGSIVDYSVNPGSRRSVYENPLVPDALNETNFYSYFGYSVTTGKFFQSEGQLYAVGAPRDAMYIGKVYIIKMEINSNSMRIKMRKNGSQLGEYFGASVLGVDLNGDSLTDLLVGAPMNSQELGDEGKVYVYISDKRILVDGPELTGDRKVSARFGTALANIGDLNQDGYNDVAIGAPYEDGHGAVYIYHGSRAGIQSEYAQKIEAFKVNSKLSGFGIHISRGLDIDDNGYPDLVVGSYRSSLAVLFRSRPVMRSFPELNFTPKQISVNHTCAFNNQNLTCVMVEACLWYKGRHVPSPLKFAFTLSVQANRGFFSRDGRNKSFSTREEADVTRNDRTCPMFWLYLNPTRTDFLTPIPVQFSNSLVPPIDSEKKFNKSYAIYQPFIPTTITAKIPFHTGCEEDKCHSNLIVSAVRTQPNGSEAMTIGEFSRVTATVSVRNEGEPAYLSELLIFVPPELSITSVVDERLCEPDSERYNASLVCNIGNPLYNESGQVDIHLKLDATEIPPHTKYLDIRFKAVTQSNETDPKDNEKVLPLHLKTVADFGISGFSSQDQIIYDGKRNVSNLITHTYTVRNYGPSTLQIIEFTLQVPYAFSTSGEPKPFLYLNTPKVDNGLIRTTCDDTELKLVRPIVQERQEIINDELSGIEGNALPSLVPAKLVRSPRGLTDVQPDNIEAEDVQSRNTSEAIEITGPNSLQCDNNNDVKCVTIQCIAEPFKVLTKFAQISIDFELDFDALNDQLGKWHQVEFVTSGNISVPDTSVIVLSHHPDVKHVRTVAFHQGALPPEEVAPWIVFVGIGVGGLLLLIILIVLIKVGFFKRKENDRLKSLKDEPENKQFDQETNDTEVLSE